VADLIVRSKREGKVAVLVVSGEARLECIDALRKEGRALAASGVSNLLVDLAGLTFADSASVGALLEMQKACAAAGGRFVLFGCSARLSRQMADMGLTGRFVLAPDEGAARKALA
jgi:anti-sigma B factor antagonist